MTSLSSQPPAASVGGIGSAYAGVMDSSYAKDRQSKPELGFRLRSRAAVVARAWRQYGSSDPPRLLEIGAAEGRTLTEIARRIGVGEYLGIELDPGLIEAAESLPANVRLERGDAMRLPSSLEDSSFDAVAMMAVLEHLPDPTAAVAEALRVLRPWGILVASCPNPFWDAVAGRLKLVQSDHHLSRFRLADLVELMTSEGLEVLDARRLMWAPVASLPYLGIPISPDWALRADAWIDRLPFLRRLCVNAYVVARKPGNSDR